MEGTQHRASKLKQKNKSHKTSGHHASKRSRKSAAKGRVARRRLPGKSIKTLQTLTGRKTRMNALRQSQKRARQLNNARNRYGAHKPRVCALVAMGPGADLVKIASDIAKDVRENHAAGGNAKDQMDTEPALLVNRPHTTHCTFKHGSSRRFRLTLIPTSRAVLSVLDAAKVADIIVFVVPVSGDPDNCVDDLGLRTLSAIRVQGLPARVGVVDGLEKLPRKRANNMKKQAMIFFRQQFCDKGIKVSDATNPRAMARSLLEMAEPKPLRWRANRSYLCASDLKVATPRAPRSAVRISGYLQGTPMSPNTLVHISGVGTCQLHGIEVAAQRGGKHAAGAKAKVLLASGAPSLREEAEVDMMSHEQSFPTEDEMGDKVSAAAAAVPLPKMAVEAPENSANDDDDAGESGSGIGSEGEGEGEGAEESIRSEMLLEQERRRRWEREDMEFPDEVDTPLDTPARQRFARYRGLQSLRTSAWDPKESLPPSYERIFQFEDFGAMQRQVSAAVSGKSAALDALFLSKFEAAQKNAPGKKKNLMTLEEAMVADDGDSVSVAGNLVTLLVKNVPVEALIKTARSGPVVVSSLLPHEQKLSVVHCSVKRHRNFSQEVIKSKSVLEMHVGFRRRLVKVVFSENNLQGDKHKMSRFLQKEAQDAVASAFFPISYSPNPALFFQCKLSPAPTDADTTGSHEEKEARERLKMQNRITERALVGGGSLMGVDPDRIVLKRIVLTGYPIRTHGNRSVVRMMFFHPDDVKWFKPVELVTKYGHIGHINEALGTHGYMKCTFNKHILNHDTVCLRLYKRVFPKFLTDPSSKRAAEGSALDLSAVPEGEEDFSVAARIALDPVDSDEDDDL